MLKRFMPRFLDYRAILCLLPLLFSCSQHKMLAASKPGSISVQVKVTDKATGSAIDNADVVIRWGEGNSLDANTNSSGLARFNDVPRGKVMIRVIGKGYETVAPLFNLAKDKQPINIELDKQSFADSEHPGTRDRATDKGKSKESLALRLVKILF